MKRFGDGGDLRLGGDLRRELLFIQQFGAATSLVLTALVILLLDPGKRPLLLRAVVAVLANSLVLWLLKMLIGRPRPRFGVPTTFLGPFSTFDLPRGGPSSPTTLTAHAWEFWRGIGSDLWSMPSSHTGSAACFAVVLAWMYPRLTVLVVPLVAVVAACRLIFDAHYPSDVVVGAAVGGVVGWGVMAKAGSKGS